MDLFSTLDSSLLFASLASLLKFSTLTNGSIKTHLSQKKLKKQCLLIQTISSLLRLRLHLVSVFSPDNDEQEVCPPPPGRPPGRANVGVGRPALVVDRATHPAVYRRWYSGE